MSNPKERHYWSQLRAALTAGQWHSNTPAKTPKGDYISWSELFRKFRKHCRGAHDVANVASHTLNLALLIEEDEDEHALAIDSECLVKQERIDMVKAGYEQLLTLDSSNLDTINFALAYHAYALGDPALCISHLNKVPDLTPNVSSTNLLVPSSYASSTASSFTPSPADSTAPEARDGRALAMTEAFRSICLQGMALERLHPASPSTALQTYRSVLLNLFPSLKSQFTLKSLVLLHQNHKPPSSKPDFTLFHQLRELWRWVERIIWRAVVLSATVCDVRKGWNPDQSVDEQGDSLWTWLSHYSYYSTYWPSTFRTSHRSTIASIHIRALISLHRPSSSSILIPPSLPSPSKPQKSPPAWLHQARLAIQDYQAILTVSTTFPRAGTRNHKVEEFVDLCVAVWEVCLFEGARAHVSWVIDILWWATRLTFNSSRILRHMTRVLYLSNNDTNLAKRVLKLYIQVVGKAYETSGSVSVSSTCEEGEREDEDTDTDENWVDTLVFGAIMLCKSVSASPSITEMDDLNEAHQIIEKAKTRLDKADKRLVAKVSLAEGVYWMIVGVKGQDPLTRPAHLSLSHSLLLQSVQTDPTPSGYYHLALSYAIPGASSAQGSSPTNPNYNLSQATEYAGLAVESDPGDVKYWHLLGLLLAAQERWEAAREVLERGADLGGTDDDDEGEEGVEGLPKGSEDGTTTDDSGTVEVDARTLLGPPVPTTNGDANVAPAIKMNGTGNAPIIGLPSSTSKIINVQDPPQPIYILPQSPSTTTLSLPPSSTLLLTPQPFKYPPSPYELFESHLQLRMTQGAVTEVVEGAEGAEVLWLEVFGWVAERKIAAAVVDDAGLSGVGIGIGGGGGEKRRSIDGITQRSISSQHNTTTSTVNVSLHHHNHLHLNLHHHGKPTNQVYQTHHQTAGSSDLETNNGSVTESFSPPIPIMISPATPIEKDKPKERGGDENVMPMGVFERQREKEKEKEKEGKDHQTKEKRTLNNTFRPKRSTSIDDTSNNNNNNRLLDVQQKSKKNVGQMLKGSVKKSRDGITAATKKLGHGVVRHGGLRRSTSTPDFHAVFQQSTSYQASSIHSRRRLSFISASRESPLPTESPPPPLPTQPASRSPTPTPTTTTTTSTTVQQDFKPNNTNDDRSMKENRLLSDLWLMSAATFRRLGKIDQAKGAIQEAEVRDENNPAVWVQFGLYYIAMGMYQHAVDTFQKALFICPDDVAATVHLSRLYLDPELNARLHSSNQSITTTSTSTTDNNNNNDNNNKSSSEPPTSPSFSHPSPPPTPLPNSDVDLAAGMLSYLSKGRGWNVPEVWYYLAKAYGLQGRKEEEKETLRLALELAERRGVRDFGSALGWCCL